MLVLLDAVRGRDVAAVGEEEAGEKGDGEGRGRAVVLARVEAEEEAAALREAVAAAQETPRRCGRRWRRSGSRRPAPRARPWP